MDYYSIKVFLPWFIWISSVSFLDLSRAQPGTASLDCIGKLLPCQPYLQSSSPPDTCCTPLAGMVDGEGDCFCQIFNDPGLLKSFNVTQEQALKLPKNCGMNADVSGCKNRPTPPTSSTPTSDSRSGNPKAADWATYFVGNGFVVVLVALFVSAF